MQHEPLFLFLNISVDLTKHIRGALSVTKKLFLWDLRILTLLPPSPLSLSSVPIVPFISAHTDSLPPFMADDWTGCCWSKSVIVSLLSVMLGVLIAVGATSASTMAYHTESLKTYIVFNVFVNIFQDNRRNFLVAFFNRLTVIHLKDTTTIFPTLW